MAYSYVNSGDNGKRRRRSYSFNKQWLGRNANDESLKRYCFEIWSNLVRERDGYKCFMCNKTTHLNAHHIISKKWIKTSLDIQCGITLCADCHDNCLQSVHISPWIFEKKLKENRPDQHKWYMANLQWDTPAPQQGINFKEELKRLLLEYEKIKPTIYLRSNYFKFSEEDEKSICKEYVEGSSGNILSKKYKCSLPALLGVLHRNNIKIIYGRQSKENKLKMKNILQKACGHCVCKLDRNGDVIGEYVSMNEAAKQHGVVINSIRNCVKGYSKTCAGFKWILKKDLKNNILGNTIT